MEVFAVEDNMVEDSLDFVKGQNYGRYPGPEQ